MERTPEDEPLDFQAQLISAFAAPVSRGGSNRYARDVTRSEMSSLSSTSRSLAADSSLIDLGETLAYSTTCPLETNYGAPLLSDSGLAFLLYFWLCI